MNNIFKLAIIGGGPAGIMACISAQLKGDKICLIEKNKFLARKMLLTGKGRCNLTNVKEIDQLVEAFGSKGRFLYGALTRFSNQDLMAFFEKRKVSLKVERGGRVFPESDQAITILNCLENELKKKKIRLFMDFPASKVGLKDGLFKIISGSKEILAEKLIIATGGKSYPQTGSTGDGYWFAKKLGHKIITPKPALVPLIVEDKKIRSLAGLSLKNISLSFLTKDKVFSKEFGEMLFTHQGISGPIVLKSSNKVYRELKKGNFVKAKIDLKPALDKVVLKKRIYREISQEPKQEYQSLLKTLLPRLLINYVLKTVAIDQHQQNSTLSKEQVKSLIDFLKDFNFQVDRVEKIDKAIVTDGGIDINEIDSKTMESKITPGLFFAGEIIALAGLTGGFNLQKAFSTGWVAGKSSSKI